jgi:hypothetical protein
MFSTPIFGIFIKDQPTRAVVTTKKGISIPFSKHAQLASIVLASTPATAAVSGATN